MTTAPDLLTRRDVLALPPPRQRELFAEIVGRIAGNYDPRVPRDWHGAYGFEITDHRDLDFTLTVDADRLTVCGGVDGVVARAAQPLASFLVLAAAHDFSPAALLEDAPGWGLAGEVDGVWGRIGRLVTYAPAGLRADLDRLTRRTPTDERLIVTSAASRDDVAAALAAKLPLLWRGAVAHWPLCRRSTTEFVDRYGALGFGRHSAGEQSRATLGQLPPGASGQLTFREIVDQRGWDTGELPDEVRGEIGALPDALELEVGHIESFLSGAGADTPLHTDLVDGVVTCALAERIVRLYGPSQAERIYACRSLEMGDYWKSHVEDPRRADRDQFPLLASARSTEIALRPGDLLVLPAGWFHHVWVQETSLAMKFSYSLEQTWRGTGAPSTAATEVMS